MTDMNTMRVIPFCGKVDEWPIWSEKFTSNHPLVILKQKQLKDPPGMTVSIIKHGEDIQQRNALKEKHKQPTYYPSNHN
jgi:hypothetical protein